MAASGRIEVSAPRQFDCGESLDHHHRRAAVWTMPGRGDFRGALQRRRRRRFARQQLLAEREAFGAEAIRQKAEVPYSDEALRQHMQEETAQELDPDERHRALFAAMSVVLPAEGNVLAVERQQSMIGDGDPMRVSAQVPQDLRRAAKSGFGVNHPVLPVKLTQEPTKLFRVSQRGSRTGATQLFAPIEAFQTGAELAAKHAAEDFHRQKEPISRAHPMAVIGREPARWDDAVNVRMEKQVLSPGMQN